MSSPSTQLSPAMGIYEPFHHMTRWGDTLRGNDSPNTDSSAILNVDARLDNKVTWHQPEYASPEEVQAYRSDQEGSRPVDKIQRRLAQNREAARKSRLRKKAYVQQLETSRLKLAQMEQELERARRQMQGIYIAGASDASYPGFSGTNNSAIAAFEMEYGHWVEEQSRQICELRNALQVHITDIELRILVESGLSHYYNLFRIKGDVAKADVFYLISGIWRTPTERFFHWLGGFRPSEILNVIMPQIETLTDQQMLEVGNLRQSSQQAEDALSQGIDQLQQTLAQCIAAAGISPGDYTSQVAACAEKLDALESFVSQADHLRQQTLQHMHRILTTRQAARGLLALGEYFHRLRALSSLWAARPREPT